MDARCHIEMLGGLRVVQGDRVITRFRTQKVGALRAYLAYYPERDHPREMLDHRGLSPPTLAFPGRARSSNHAAPGWWVNFRPDDLAEWLWLESEPAAGRRSLRNALSSLRRQLEGPGVPHGTFLRTNRLTVQLNPATTTDVAAFQSVLQAAQQTGNETERAHHLQAAVDLYGGELLPAYYQDWVLTERRHLADLYFPSLQPWIAPLDQAVEIVRHIMEPGAGGVYLDTTTGNGYQCFNPDHGHPVGGGNYWARGHRRYLKRVREVVKTMNPDGIMTGENPCESYNESPRLKQEVFCTSLTAQRGMRKRIRDG